MSGMSKNWFQIFKSKNAIESKINIAEHREEINEMHTIEIEYQNKHFFIIPDLYEKRDSKIYKAADIDAQSLYYEYQGNSILNSDDKLFFRKFIMQTFDDVFLEDLKCQIHEKQEQEKINNGNI